MVVLRVADPGLPLPPACSGPCSPAHPPLGWPSWGQFAPPRGISWGRSSVGSVLPCVSSTKSRLSLVSVRVIPI